MFPGEWKWILPERRKTWKQSVKDATENRGLKEGNWEDRNT